MSAMNPQIAVRLFGVGLGPGDPDYMTVRARRMLKSADRLVHFCKRGGAATRAPSPTPSSASKPAREIALVYPVTTEIPTDDPDYAAAIRPFYEETAARLHAGDRRRAVPLRCSAKATLSSTVPSCISGGGSGIACRSRSCPPSPECPGAWTRAGAPIISGDDVLTVIPGTLLGGRTRRGISRGPMPRSS